MTQVELINTQILALIARLPRAIDEDRAAQAALAAKNPLTRQPAPAIDTSADHDVAKFLITVGLAEAELEKLNAGAPGTRIKKHLKTITTEAPRNRAGGWDKIQQAITTALAELELIDKGLDVSALESKLNEINQLANAKVNSDVTIADTNQPIDLEGPA